MYTMGIDIGSTSSKTVIMEDGVRILEFVVIPLGTGTKGPGMAIEEVLRKSGISGKEIGKIVATGYGRLNCDIADCQVSELSCHARGIHFLLPQVRTVIDIGGQDAKALRLSSDGRLSAFQMNDKCAAGTGRFLNVMARVLNVDVGQLGPVSETSANPVSISNTCTVFAESEVISRLSGGLPLEDIIAGIHSSVAKRVAGMALRLGKPGCTAMSGGVALNSGVVRAMERELGVPVLVDPLCQSAGAIGAACLAWDKIRKEQNKQ